MAADFNKRLDEEFNVSKSHLPNRADWLDGRWQGLEVAPKNSDRRGETSVSEEELKQVGKALVTPRRRASTCTRPSCGSWKPRPKMFETGEGFDWATCEALAFGTLLNDGFYVRLSGQDSQRGTFSQRHAALVDQQTEERYFPLQHVNDSQGCFEAIDTLLSEEAVLALNMATPPPSPRRWCCGKPSSGDFANGAQVVMDQFIAKW